MGERLPRRVGLLAAGDRGTVSARREADSGRAQLEAGSGRRGAGLEAAVEPEVEAGQGRPTSTGCSHNRARWGPGEEILLAEVACAHGVGSYLRLRRLSLRRGLCLSMGLSMGLRVLALLGCLVKPLSQLLLPVVLWDESSQARF